MAIRTYDILLDSYNSTMPEPIVGRQGDKNGAVTLHVTITDRGTAVNLNGQTINLMAETAKGTAIIADNGGVTVTNAIGGKFDYAIPNALWSESGKITKAYFSLSDANGKQTTYDLIFIVKKAIDVSQKTADDYITIIDGTLRSLEKKINDFNTPETFTNLAAIQAKYPSGKNGLMVAADNGHKYIWANNVWTDAGIYQSVGIADGSISPIKTNFITVINQALDKSSAVENAYWYFSGNMGQNVGQTTNATGVWAYNKVHVNKGETWSVLQARLVFSGFTDAQGNKLSQFSTTDVTGDIEYTADQDGYICVSAEGTTPKLINLPLADITDDMRTSPAGVIGTRITGIYLTADNHKKITVSTASELLKAINDLSNDTNYSDATIYLKEGVYDLYTAMGGASYIASVDAAASGAMFGLNLPDRVSLVGNPHATITFEVPDDVATLTSSTRISVISILRTHTLENLDIIGKNVRYAVHDETGNGVSGLTRVVKNCHIEHLGNASGLWSSTQAYAIGTGSGGSYDFENTVFKSVSSAWSAHDNANQNDNTFTFNQCKFVAGSDYSIRFGTYGSGNDMNHVTINNCDIDKYIYVMEEIPDSKTGMRFELKGGGNTKVPYWSVNSAGTRLPIEFRDETARITNIGTNTIQGGTPIKLTDIGKGISMGPTDGAYMAYGIALEDIDPGKNGVVKYAGYLSRDDTPLSSLTVGSRIGIIDGKLAPTNDDNYIGVVTQWRNILLKF